MNRTQITPIQPKKYSVFAEHDELDEAMDCILAEYPEHDHQILFNSVMAYHNTLIKKSEFQLCQFWHGLIYLKH